MHGDGKYNIGAIYRLGLGINIRASPWEHTKCLTTIDSHTRKKKTKKLEPHLCFHLE
jgi:hypothetical protein